MDTPTDRSPLDQAQRMRRYYRRQSKIYDATRWTFLFGRSGLVRRLPLASDTSALLVEVGCGTGHNLRRLARRFGRARLLGFDVSTDMVRRSQKRTERFGDRVRVREEPFTGQTWLPRPPRLVLFSYALTMINPQWSQLLDLARDRLAPGGYVAVVDFHDTPNPWFRRHMARHHVRMEGHLLPALRKRFVPGHEAVKPAYLGVWRYLEFVGQKPE